MKKPRITNKIIVYITLIIFALTLIVSLSLYLFIAPNVLKNEQIHNLKLLEAASLGTENFFKDRLDSIIKVKDIVLNIENEEKIKKYIDEYKKSQNDFDGFYIFNNNGQSFGNINIDQNVLVNKYDNLPKIVEGLEGGEISIYAVSPFSFNGKTGAVVGKINTSLLPLDQKIIIIGSNNNVIYKNINTVIDSNQLQSINLKYQTAGNQLIEYKDKIAIVTEIKSLNWTIISVFSSHEFYGESISIIYRTILSVIFIGVISIFVILLVWTLLLKSISKLVNGVFAVENGDLNFKITHSPQDILKEVSEGFNKMVQKLRDNYDKLHKQAEELYERNWQIEEANRELEDSYEKLQETINQLNEAEEKYYSLVKNIPEIVAVIDNEGMITFINDVVLDILGYHKSELIGKNIDLIIDSDLSHKFLAIMNKRLKKRNKIIFEMPMIRKDGSIIVAEAKVTYHLRNGNIDGIQTIVRDITKSKKMQKEIIHKNEELLTIYNISKSLSSTIELDNVFELIVNEVCKILNADMCILRLLDMSRQHLILKAYSGSFFDNVTEDELRQFSIMDYSASGADLVNIRDIVFIDRFEENWIVNHINSKRQPSDRLSQISLVPICSKDKVLGAIAVGTKNKVNEKHLNILNSIANNAAVAIENATLYENSKKYFIKTIDALIAAVEAKDKYTEGHSRRVSKYVDMIGNALDLPKDKLEDLKIAGILHDVGKIGISDSILLKPGRLTQEEYEEVKQHPIISNRILYSVGLSETTMKAIACHHERYDGKGYPFGLKGNELSLECQIIAVADAFDAMTSNRSYRQALSVDDAVNEIASNRGTQFGPLVVDALIDLYKNDCEKIITALKDTEFAG